MSNSPTINLTLPEWAGGSLKIRFIYLVNPTSFRLTGCPEKVSFVASLRNSILEKRSQLTFTLIIPETIDGFWISAELLLLVYPRAFE